MDNKSNNQQSKRLKDKKYKKQIDIKRKALEKGKLIKK